MSRARKPRIVGNRQLAASVAALAAFGGIASVDEPTPLDWRVHAWAGSVYRRPMDWVQAPLELFGLPGAYIPLTVLASRQLRRRGQRGRRAGAALVGAAVAGWLTVRVMRLLIFRPRPPDPPRRRNDTESTFPSGHTTGVTTLITVATAVLRDEQILTPVQAAALRVGVPLMFGFNRLYVREHWLTDVLGGLAMGTAVGEAILATTWTADSRR